MLCFLPCFPSEILLIYQGSDEKRWKFEKDIRIPCLCCCCNVILLIYFCKTNYLKTLWLKTFISSQFLWVRIWEWFCWIVLTYTISWGNKQNVSSDCSHLKAWLGWKIHIQAYSCDLAGGLRSLLAVGWKPQFLTSRASLFSPHGGNLPRENDPRDRIGNYNVFHNRFWRCHSTTSAVFYWSHQQWGSGPHRVSVPNSPGSMKGHLGSWLPQEVTKGINSNS